MKFVFSLVAAMMAVAMFSPGAGANDVLVSVTRLDDFLFPNSQYAVAVDINLDSMGATSVSASVGSLVLNLESDDGLDWSEEEIAYYLGTGFTPEFDTAGGEMAIVVSELAKLPEEDRAAIAAYLKAVPSVEPAAE